MLGCGSLRTAHKLGSPRLALSRAFCRLAERRALRRNLFGRCLPWKCFCLFQKTRHGLEETTWASQPGGLEAELEVCSHARSSLSVSVPVFLSLSILFLILQPIEYMSWVFFFYCLQLRCDRTQSSKSKTMDNLEKIHSVDSL